MVCRLTVGMKGEYRRVKLLCTECQVLEIAAAAVLFSSAAEGELCLSETTRQTDAHMDMHVKKKDGQMLICICGSDCFEAV